MQISTEEFHKNQECGFIQERTTEREGKTTTPHIKSYRIISLSQLQSASTLSAQHAAE